MNLIYLLNSAEDFFEIENLKLNKKAKERFHLFFSKINFPMTLYIEQFCNDKDYSDIFYNFYSSKFQFPSKYTKRLIFFEGVIKKEDILNQDFNLEDRLIGIMVLRPIKNQIGKVLINPQKLKIDGFIRTTSLEIGCCGRKMCLESFPFSAQDSEFMSCAETTLWSILNYYGTRYPEYKTALPHEIVKISDENGYQRVLPSSGLNYMMSSLILKKFGFASKIYYRLIENKTEESEINFKRWFHYYVESGIPIMVGIKFEGENIGHAISCVGHGKIHVDLNRSYKIDNFEIYNSADFIHEYIYMDDNRIPFEISEFDKFNGYDKNTLIKYFIVPLYKRIYIDASEAEKVFLNVLKNKYLGISNLKEFGTKFAIRIFLTTSKNYKNGRFIGNGNENVKDLYINLSMPKFVWVCEITTIDLYKKGKALGEIVIDVTATIGDFNELFLIRYPKKFLFKHKNDNIMTMKKKLENIKKIPKEFDILKTNLREIKNV